MYRHITCLKSLSPPQRGRICQLTFFWMRFHSPFLHWFSCSRKAQSAMLPTANVLYLVVSRVERGQVFTLPLRDITGVTTIDENAVMVSTYLPEESAWS